MGRMHDLQLALTSGIGPILARRLITALGSAERVCSASIHELQIAEGIGSTRARAISQSLKEAAEAAPRELERAQQAGIEIITLDDDRYPPLLRTIPDPPLVLYLLGNIEPRDLHALAIVGSRRCSYYGREQAERFAALLAGAGLTVVSGGARGIDSSAHRGALSHPQGRTIAVLGCGVDVVYPPENTALFKLIASRGAVLSEYPLGTPPLQENFPRRNRIVSGMSRGVLVVEADERSGALITARQCIDDHNRPVFALPGRVDNALSAGPHELIRQGAVLTRGLEDILGELGPLPAELEAVLPPLEAAEPTEPPANPPPAVSVSPAGRQILSQLDGQTTSVDQLIEQTGLSAQQILQELTYLTLKGLVRRVDGQSYARTRH
ncbi:MAG: DNA-protecting protein DprA [Phycisphaerales bacterium]|nr:DNA-protecting protein DprA [Phycisphaerales bacterium]